MTDNNMLTIIEENKLDPVHAKPLLDSFGDYFVEAHKLVAKAGTIRVTSEDQVNEMAMAKALRKQLRDLRVEANKTRVTLKEGYLRGGNAVQAIYNDIEKIIKPEEERLEKQEKFAELLAAERLQKRYEERVDRLFKYGADPSLYQLRDMADDSFQKLIADLESARKVQEEADRKAEIERLDIEKKKELLRQRQIETAPYRDFLESEMTEEIDNATYVKLLDSAVKAKKKHDAEQEQIRKDNEQLRVQADNDRKAKEAAEKKLADERALQEKKILEEKQRLANQKRVEEQAAAKAKADEEERQRQEMIAPDKFKLVKLAQTLLEIELPAVKSNKAGVTVREVEKSLASLSSYINQKAKEL